MPSDAKSTDNSSTSAHVHEDVLGDYRYRIILLTLIFIVVVGFVAWKSIKHGQEKVVHHQAVNIAEIVARMATSARSVYAKNIVEKLRQEGTGAHINSHGNTGYVPLPAQFLKLLGQRTTKDVDGLYRYRPLSKWNLEQTQGLRDDFQHWGWSQLEKQDVTEPTAPIQWQPVWRIETMNGIKTLRYLRADPANGASCVSCHNSYERRTEILKRRNINEVANAKQWKRYQLMGAIEVNIPLDKADALTIKETGLTLSLIVAVLLVGMTGIGFFIFLDISRARSMARELSWRANYDALTELPNRSSFELKLDLLLRLCKVDGSSHAIMYLDLDQFKLVNDTCGHSAGDELLRQIGELIHSSLRSGDTVARLGGDEFGIILENCPLKEAHEIAEKIRLEISEFRYVWKDKTFEVALSIGLVPVTDKSLDVSSLLSAADLACYVAKDSGRNQVHVSTESDKTLESHLSDMQWATKIRKALDEGRMKLAVQDVKCLKPENELQLYQEVLLRMVDEQGEPVPTDAVISAAERYNLMQSIDRWVVRTVFSMITENKLSVGPQSLVAINLSGVSLSDNDFLEYVREQLLEFDVIPPECICFEVTETAAIRNFSKLRSFIITMQELGCKFALDDFGSGLSSFGYLKKLPVDFIKIDGTFVRDILTDPMDRVMVESIILMSRTMGKSVIAEWVENDEILEQVKSLEADFVQGFGIAHPRLIT